MQATAMGDGDCTHHWMLDALPIEGIVHGCCKWCGDVYAREHAGFCDVFNGPVGGQDVGAIMAGALRPR